MRTRRRDFKRWSPRDDRISTQRGEDAMMKYIDICLEMGGTDKTTRYNGKIKA